MRKIPEYETPTGTKCPECGEYCMIVALQNEFDYAGTHCNHGEAGTHYPNDWGRPVSDCCEADMEGQIYDPDFDDYEDKLDYLLRREP